MRYNLSLLLKTNWARVTKPCKQTPPFSHWDWQCFTVRFNRSFNPCVSFVAWLGMTTCVSSHRASTTLISSTGQWFVSYIPGMCTAAAQNQSLPITPECWLHFHRCPLSASGQLPGHLAPIKPRLWPSQLGLLWPKRHLWLEQLWTRNRLSSPRVQEKGGACVSPCQNHTVPTNTGVLPSAEIMQRHGQAGSLHTWVDLSTPKCMEIMLRWHRSSCCERWGRQLWYVTPSGLPEIARSNKKLSLCSKKKRCPIVAATKSTGRTEVAFQQDTLSGIKGITKC